MSNTPDPIKTQARHAHKALRRLYRIALRECGVKDTPKEPFKLNWSTDATAEQLAQDALTQATEIASRYHPLRKGCVYCYACQSAACSHAAPPSPGAVFIGYSDTGLARWGELFEFLLQEEDPRTDLLFADPPVTLARMIPRHTLVQHQLLPFGRNSLTYRIWGQVVAGYLRAGEERAALTLQLIETRDHKLTLHLLCSEALREMLADVPNERRSPLHRVYNAIREAERQTESISGLWKGSRGEKARKHLRDKVYSMLRHLSNSIDRKGRQHQRRTTHADMRGSQQKRPVHKAYEDLQAARESDFFHDSKEDSYIVLGKGHRIHVFSPEGKHITSMTLAGDELQRRYRRKRYHALEVQTIERFKQAAASRLK